MAAIDIATFSSDLWLSGRGPSFFSVLLQAPSVQWLHMFAAGLDSPLFTELRRRGMRLTNSPGSTARPIAHTVMMHLVALCRNARRFADAQQRHEWAARAIANEDLEGRTVGIIGLGNIGAEVALLAPHFGMRVIGMRRSPTGAEPCETWPVTRLHELLPLVDDLVLTAPLTDDTRGIIGADELALLRPGAHVVNVGRGELIDEDAMIAALSAGHLGGAALDVFVTEPLPAESPLWDLPNVIVTPHAAAGTPLGADRAADMFTRNLAAFVRGEPMPTEVP